MKPRLGIAALALALLTPQPAAAYVIPVFDAGSFAQLLRIRDKIYAIYKQKVEQKLILARIRERYGDMSHYRTSAIKGTIHDVGRYAEARAFLTALNAGDARGDLYRQAVRTVGALPGVVDKLPPEARALIRRHYGDVESADSILERAVHATAEIRGFSAGSMAAAISALEDDVTSDRTAHHDLTARLDVISAAELLARRQTHAENLQISHLLEISLIQGKRTREAEATAARMRLDTLTAPLPDRDRLTTDIVRFRLP